MTTFKEATAAIQVKLLAEWTHADVPLFWQNETNDLPATPAPLVYVEVIGESERIVGFGGGRGNNLWRKDGRIEAHVFVQKGTAIATANQYADEIGAIFRGQRFSGVDCWQAAVLDGQSDADNGNYFGVTARIDFTVDLTG